MAIDLPAFIAEAEPEIRRFESSAMSGGRLVNVVEYADPVWVVNALTRRMHVEDFRAAEAWMASLRGSLRTVLYRHPKYAAPRAHAANPAPAAQAGTVSAIANGNVLTIAGVASGLVLSAGDYLSFAQGEARGLGQVIASTGSGTSRTVTVEPAFPRHLTVGATVRFDRAELLMRVVPSSWKVDRQNVLRSASFELMESRT